MKRKSAIKNIIWIGLITGTLDAIAALLLNYKINSEIIFRFIASGVFGKAAFAGGQEMVTSGIIFHYLIAYVFTAAFYLLYPFFNSTVKNKYLIAVVYGTSAWLIMNLIVIPLSHIGMHHIKPLNIITGIAALIICVGLPVALIADSHLKKSR